MSYLPQFSMHATMYLGIIDFLQVRGCPCRRVRAALMPAPARAGLEPQQKVGAVVEGECRRRKRHRCSLRPRLLPHALLPPPSPLPPQLLSPLSPPPQVFVQRVDTDGVSAMEPQAYARRFMSMVEHTFVEQE